MVLEAERKKKKGGIAMNLTGKKFICFSHFFYAFLCLCCLRTRVRTLGTVCVGCQSFGVRFVLRLFFWILDSFRKVLKKILRASLNRMNWLGNKISRFTEFSLLEQQFGSLAPFVSVLSHSDLVFYSICFFGFLNL